MDHVVSGSRVDPSRSWTGSGELQTVLDRVVDGDALEDVVSVVLEAEHAHLALVLRALTRVCDALREGSPTEAADALLEVVTAEEARGRPDRALAFSDAALRVLEGSPDLAMRSLALRRRARAARTRGQLAEAERDYGEAHELALAAGDPQGAAEAAIGAGNATEPTGEWSRAADWYRRALAALGALGADYAEAVPEAWHALLNLHVVLRSEGKLEESRKPLERARRIAEILDDELARSFIENAEGQWLMAKGAFDDAVRHLRDAVGAMGSLPALAAVGIRLNLSEALLASGRTLEAAEEARRAEKDAIVGRVHGKLPEVYRLLGRIVTAEGNQEAFVLFERALEIQSERALPVLERALTLHAYARSSRALGDHDRAEALSASADEAYREAGVLRRLEWADTYATDGSQLLRPDDELEDNSAGS